MPTQRQVALVRSIAIAVVGAVVIWLGGAAVILAIFGRHAPTAAPWLALAKFVSLAWAVGIGWLISWHRMDEMAREARKINWLIGSTGAIVVTAPIMLLWLLNGGAVLAHLIGNRGTPGAFFAMGWVGLVLTQLLGSLIAAIVWRVRMR